MINKKYGYLSVFLCIAFILPMISVALQSISDNSLFDFVLYGIGAAAPSIAALIVLGISRKCRDFWEKYFHVRHLLMAVISPVIIVCWTMFFAKLIYCLVFKTEFTIGRVSGVQFVIILWALIAEEIGWRGYLLSFLKEHMKRSYLVPFIVGVIWCLWHYHFFLFGGMDVPILWFFISCIVESYIYSYLLDLTENNLLSAMIYHFVWNLCIHVFAINPNDNQGNPLPYIILVVVELLSTFLLLLVVKKKKLGTNYAKLNI